MAPQDFAREFAAYAARKLEQNLDQIMRCAALLSDDELWHRPNEHSNAIGNLVLHLTGNVRQWIVASIGGEAFERARPAEFAQWVSLPRAPLLGELERVVRHAVAILKEISPAALSAGHQVQGYSVTGLTVVFHVTEHFSFHTGQIIYATKLLRNVDVSLYDEQGRHRAGAQAGP